MSTYLLRLLNISTAVRTIFCLYFLQQQQYYLRYSSNDISRLLTEDVIAPLLQALDHLQANVWLVRYGLYCRRSWGLWICKETATIAVCLHHATRLLGTAILLIIPELLSDFYILLCGRVGLYGRST